MYGIHPVVEAIAAGRRKIYEIYISPGKTLPRIDEIAQKLKSDGIPVKELPSHQIQVISGKDSHQGIAAKVSPYPVMTLFDLIDQHERLSLKPLYLLIDHVVDPQNLGALIRTSLCVGVNGVIIPKDRSAAPSPVVSKTSAGALEHIRLAQVPNMVYAISDLKKNGIWIIGLEKNGSHSIFDTDLTEGLGIVIGSEESGIRPLIKKNCDFLSFIPQTGPINSLNASVAGGVTLYEAYRQRHA